MRTRFSLASLGPPLRKLSVGGPVNVLLALLVPSPSAVEVPVNENAAVVVPVSAIATAATVTAVLRYSTATRTPVLQRLQLLLGSISFASRYSDIRTSSKQLALNLCSKTQ